jgi:hypothetical protein
VLWFILSFLYGELSAHCWLWKDGCLPVEWRQTICGFNVSNVDESTLYLCYTSHFLLLKMNGLAAPVTFWSANRLSNFLPWHVPRHRSCLFECPPRLDKFHTLCLCFISLNSFMAKKKSAPSTDRAPGKAFEVYLTMRRGISFIDYGHLARTN